jgi:replicative DNA helicase
MPHIDPDSNEPIKVVGHVATPKISQAEALELWKKNREFLSLPTTLQDLDAALGGGLPIHQITTSLGYTGSHKSELARQFRRRMSLNGTYVLHVDVELGAERIVERDLAQEAHISPRRLREGLLSKEEYERLEAAEEIIRANDHIATYSLRNMETVQTLLQSLERDVEACSGVGRAAVLCIFDSAQRLAVGCAGDTQRQQVQNLLWALETFSRRNQAAVLLVSEQSRGREGGAPSPDDIIATGAESRAIEYVSDVLFGLVPTAKTTQATAGDASGIWEREIQVLVGKNRNGPMGYLRSNLVFKAPCWDMDTRPRVITQTKKKEEEKKG